MRGAPHALGGYPHLSQAFLSELHSLRIDLFRDSVCLILSATGTGHMMGRQTGDQSQLFYLFNLEERIPANHLLRRLNPIVTPGLGRSARETGTFLQRYWPVFDRVIRMLIVGYCYGIRFERRLFEEVELHPLRCWRG